MILCLLVVELMAERAGAEDPKRIIQSVILELGPLGPANVTVQD